MSKQKDVADFSSFVGLLFWLIVPVRINVWQLFSLMLRGNIILLETCSLVMYYSKSVRLKIHSAPKLSKVNVLNFYLNSEEVDQGRACGTLVLVRP